MSSRLRHIIWLLILVPPLIMPSKPTIVRAQKGIYPIITPENAARLVQVDTRPATMPQSTVWQIGWGFEERTVLIHDTSGVWVLDASGEAETRFLEVPSWGVSAFSSSTLLLAVADLEGSVARWLIMPVSPDVSTVAEPLDVPDSDGHNGLVRTMAFSPDGLQLATGGMDGTVRLGDAFGGPGQQVLEAEVTSLAFSPDGALLAGGLFSNAVSIWDTATGELLLMLGDGEDTVSVLSVAFHPDGQMVAAGANDGTVTVSNVATGETVHIFEQAAIVTTVAFSPDGQVLAAGYDDGTIQLWATASGENLVTLEGHIAGVTSLGFSPAGTILYSGGLDGWVLFWGVPEAETVVPTPSIQTNVAVQASVIDSGATPITAEGAAQVGQVVELSYDYSVDDISFYPDGSVLASAIADPKQGVVWLWDTVGGAVLGNIPGEQYETSTCADFSPDGAWLAIGSSRSVRLWDMMTMQSRALGDAAELGVVVALVFSPDGSVLAGADMGGTVRLWNVATSQQAALLHTFELGWAHSLAFNLDGSLLAAGSIEGLYVWDMTTGQPVITPTEEVNPGAGGVAFSPDSTRLVAGKGVGIDIWDVATWEKVMTLEGHEAVIESIAFSPDGSVIASGSQDHTVRLWDAATGELLVVLDNHTDRVNAVIFSPGGAVLATSSRDGTVRLWMVGIGPNAP